jgi:hypothetical protein
MEQSVINPIPDFRVKSLRSFAEKAYGEDKTAKIIIKAEEMIALLNELEALDDELERMYVEVSRAS